MDVSKRITNSRLYCSKQCGYDARRAEMAIRRVLAKYQCEGCGKTCYPVQPNPRDKSRRANRWCSRGKACKPKFTGETLNPFYRVKCVGCGTARLRKKGGRYRCQECYRRKASVDHLEKAKAKHEARRFDCRECGTSVVREYGDKRKVFCSDRCSRRWSVRERGRRVGHGHRARARYFGVPYEPVNIKKVYERDGYKCRICGGRIDMKANTPAHNSKSIDHIIPMSRGGGHLWANVQAAHFGCNARKGDGSSGSQLLLL
jgi:5-methylcytosine-specific restriction endonuclease McrA